MPRKKSPYEFTIYDRKGSPNWGVYFYVDGKRKQRASIYPRDRYTIEEAQAAVNAAQGGAEEPKALTVKWMVEHVTERLKAAVKLGEIKEKTRETHINNMRYLICAFGAGYVISEIKIAEEKLKLACIDLGRKPNTINGILSTARMAFGKLAEEGYIDKNPLAKYKPLATPRFPLKAMTEDERDDLLASILSSWSTPSIGLVYILAAMGMRVTELLTIRREDVDIENWLVKTPTLKQHDGHDDVYRILRIPQSCRMWFIWFLRHTGSDYPFKVRHASTINRFIKRYFKNINPDKRVVTHSMRHSAGTIAVINGKNIRTVQKILGHASLSTTERFYLQDTADDDTLE